MDTTSVRQTIGGRLLGSALLVMLAASQGGCAVFGMMAETAAGGGIPAQHELAKKKTLVMVDDPSHQLAQPGMTRLVASSARFHLKKNTRLTDKMLVTIETLARVEAELGEDYPTTPMATVGRRAGADQVIHVLIREVELQYGGTIYRPRARTEVKVINAETGDRLFPKSENQIEGLSPRGQSVQSQLNERHVDEARQQEGGTRVLMQRALAKRIGRDVARLFHRHKQKPAGHQLNEH